jgi:methyl-accepting chemotaxis protein
MNNPNRRHQFLIDKGFQNRFIIQLTLLIVGSIVVAFGAVWAYTHLFDVKKLSFPVAETVQAAQQNLPSPLFLDILWLPTLVILLLVIVCIPIVGLFYSHRIAGPMFNLKRMLARVENGNLEQAMHIRTNDEFHDVENAFNQMLKGLNRRIMNLKTAAVQLPEPDRKKMEQAIQDNFNMSPDN